MDNVSSSKHQEYNVPKLRFPGFEGEWSTATLGELGTFTKGVSLSKADISEDGTPFILYGELYTTYDEVTEKIVRKTNQSASAEQYSKIGDVIIPTSGETPEEIATATCVMVSDVILAGDLNIYRTDTVDGRLISYIINHIVNKDISKVAQGKSVVHIKADELSKIHIRYPDKSEQDKIITFLGVLSNRISKQRELVEKLKTYKRGLIRDFLSNNCSYELRTLESLFEIKAGGDISKENCQTNQSPHFPYPVYANSLTNKGLYGYANYYKICGDTITVTGRGEIGHATARHENYVPIVRLLSLIPKTELDVDFFAEIINETNIFVESTGVPQLTSPQLGKVQVPWIEPSVQKNCAQIIKTIDNLVTKQQEIYNNLLLYKNGLLQQMFI